MLKNVTAMAAAAIVVLTSSVAVQAQGKTPYDAIVQNGQGNGAFTDQGGYVTNGKVNFSDEGAMRSVNGQGGAHASPNSAVDTDGTPACPNCGDKGEGTRVEPPGTFGK
jgi:hypothetical protein